MEMEDAQTPISLTLIFIWVLVLTEEMDGSFLPTVFHIQWMMLYLQEHSVYGLFSLDVLTKH